MKSLGPKRGDFGTYLILGSTMAAWMTGGVLTGHFVDLRFGFSPWGLILGAMFGILGCGYSVFQAARKLDSDKNP